jgi:hypothetical protein
MSSTTPLSLGEFIEFYQHQDHGTHEDWIAFKQLIETHAKVMEEQVLADTCLFQTMKKI